MKQNPLTVDMKLEVLIIGVSDVDRAKTFYENLGWTIATWKRSWLVRKVIQDEI